MVDIHSHLLYGIDDGVKTIEESIKILKELEEYGYTDIILTPHYIKNSKYNSPVSENKKRLETLKEKLKEENIKINLYLGNEIYIDSEIYDLLHNNEIYSLNNKGYLLIELPMSGEFNNYREIFHDLIRNGYKVIFAHPERYTSIQNDFNIIYELEKTGVIFQSNIESIIGAYGDRAKKTIKRLLKEKKVTFLATDIHRSKDYNEWDKAKKKMLKYITSEELNNLLGGNAKILL